MDSVDILQARLEATLASVTDDTSIINAERIVQIAIDKSFESGLPFREVFDALMATIRIIKKSDLELLTEISSEIPKYGEENESKVD